MTNFHIFTMENFGCIRNGKYSAINRNFLLLNWNYTYLKSRPVKVCYARYCLAQISPGIANIVWPKFPLEY